MSPLDSQDIDRIAEAVKRDSKPPTKTGEQEAMLTEKTRTDLKTVAMVVSVALGIAGIGAVARAAGEDAGTALAENKTQDKAIQALQVSDAENRADHKAMRELLDRIDKKMDRLEQKLDSKK